ncbi:AAA family ATPase [Nonomuraea gerenzanensis]|uniref:Putative transcriptional regulator n=1 Tax=Nonomuraea gerenzanensis TaxID=93944 RepID=A0A1M4ED53_9ACTN|nr:LuxR family transcriptional regulator [Nonomuraea gerenzanensis]UBU08315.1 AAA family ATPase [Nonomuraea gerenzanensis]SBO96646.1 putative transcriptional regulator [Nonomuraea gerenzanensis]
MDIIGRAQELGELRRAIDRAPGAAPNVVLHGDPGVGKSVLLQAGVDHARERGMRVVGGSGFESEAQLAFAGLHQLFAPVMEYLDRVEPFHRDTLLRVLGMRDGPAPDRLAISVASLAVLAAVAEDGPVLIAVEDAHWVDHPTREVMMFILLRLRPYDLRAIFARRPLTATERVTPGINVIEVGPLADEAAGELLDQLHPGLPPSVRERVLAEAAGNPLAITELPQTSVGVELLPSGASLRTRLETGFAGRLLELAPRIRTTLLVTALDGDRLEHRAELSPYELLEVERAGLVTRDSTPSGLRFRHPLVRSAIIRTASPEETRAAHAVLAEQHAGDPELRMWHLAAATVEPDERVAAEIERAARAVSLRGGSGLAVKALRRAADLTPGPAARAARLQHAAELASESGQLDLAQSLLDEARRHLDDPARALATRAQILMLRDGDLDAARRLLRGTPGAGSLVRVMAASYAQDPEEWAEVSGVVTGCDDGLVRLLHDVFLGQGAAARVRAALDALPADAPPGRVAALCRAATWMDLLPDYRDRIRDLIDGESGQGAVTHAASGYWLAAHDHFLAGQWEQAESAANAGLDLCVRHDLDLLAHDLRCSLGWLAAARGDADSAREYSRTVEQWAAPRGSGLHLSLSARNLALAAMAHGDYDSAYAYWTSISPPGVIPPYVAYAPWAVFELVESAVRTGRAEEARAHAAAAVSLAERAPRLRLHVMAARALVAPPDEAVALFRAALALPRTERWPFDHARVRLALGELQRRRLQPGEARPELRRAADLFAGIGATAWQQRAEQELRATGVAVTQRPSAAHGLTAQQLEVARLAASGLSNKEIGERLFLSSRTVSAHLYRIFPKLGITSRAALRDALEAVTADAVN